MMKQRLHWAPDACAYNVLQFRDWLFTSDKGERCLYHIGRISIDQKAYQHLKSLSGYAVLMDNFGVIKINQSRTGPDIFQYYATRTEAPVNAVPKSVALCDIDVETFICLRGISEGMEDKSINKQVSARRIVRELLGSSDDRSQSVVQSLIDAGYVNEEGRKVVVTDLGMEILI